MYDIHRARAIDLCISIDTPNGRRPLRALGFTVCLFVYLFVTIEIIYRFYDEI